MDIKEIRVVMDDGTEIVMGRVYIQELTITHNSGFRPFMDREDVLPDMSSVEVVIRLRVPGTVWRSRHAETAPPYEIERPEPFLLDRPEKYGE